MTAHPPVHVVDNRVLLIGLDELYRSAMKGHEREELLQCARRVAAALRVRPASVPVEGYYAEDRWLTEYFLLMRALQDVPESRRNEVAALPAFQRLSDVAGSALFGTVRFADKLLPQGVDPLGNALEQMSPVWSLELLVPAAHAAALANDDCSLVGLAARASDAVVLAATRESVVLYAMGMLGGLGVVHTPRFEWRVDDDLAQAATRFVRMFYELFTARLPVPQPGNAEELWLASRRADLEGRCVRIGSTPDRTRHYHWAICCNRDLDLTVQEFWAAEIWTTARYRERRGSDRCCPDMDA